VEVEKILPIEMWTLVFSFLDLREFYSISIVCKRFRNIVEDASTRETLDLTVVKRDLENHISSFLSKYKRGNITAVKLVDCYKLNDSMLSQICSTFSKTLRSLNVKECTKITSLNCIASCTSLELLNIEKCRHISSNSLQDSIPESIIALYLDNLTVTVTLIENIAKKCKSLKIISLSDCYGLNDIIIEKLTSNAHNLDSINLSWCTEITDEAIRSISKHCKEVKNLELEECYNITDQGIESLAKNCKKLTKLDLEQCFKISNRSLEALSQHSKCLRCLEIPHCQSVTLDAISKLKEQLPECNVISFK